MDEEKMIRALEILAQNVFDTDISEYGLDACDSIKSINESTGLTFQTDQIKVWLKKE